MTDHEIDLAVAKKLGDHKTYWHEYLVDGGLRRDRIEPPPYCHSIEAAWEILNSFDHRRSHVRLARSPSTHGWLVSLNNGVNDVAAEADTPEMAICLAFLKSGDK